MHLAFPTAEWEWYPSRQAAELDVKAQPTGRVTRWGGYVKPLSVSADLKFKRLQTLLGVKVDGFLGDETSGALSALGFPALAHPTTMAEFADRLIAFLERRKAYLAWARR